MNIYLDAPQDFGNVCLIARTLEVLGVRRCYVYDPHRLIRDRYGKSRTRRIQAVSAGAFHRVSFERVHDRDEFLLGLPGRKVATVPNEYRATTLASFEFRDDDTILFGSEGRGISPEALNLCEARVTIPQQGVTDSLNLAVAVGIVTYECLRQSGTSRPARETTEARQAEQGVSEAW